MVAERVESVITATDTATVDAAFASQRRAAGAEPYPDAAVRRDRLDRLADALTRHGSAIREAISADFGHRAHEETLLLEQFVSMEGIRHARRHLRGWMKPERRAVAWWSLPARARVLQQPLGVVGIIVPWNYPLYLAIGPMTAALAAGNRVMLKMSEFTPRFGELFANIIAESFGAEEVRVLNGSVEVAQHFSSLPFDHLLFTGSTRVGREVMRQAAANLTPVTLELGGKSPAIVTTDFDLDEAARRITLGKLANAGQTCVAPDYVLVPAGSEQAFVAACARAAQSYYPTVVENPQYTSIVNERQFARLQTLLEDARAKGATIHPLHPEATAKERRRLVPMALTGVTDAMLVMQEEIFGPLLPVVSYRNLDEAIAYVNARPRPLALYHFGGGAERERVLRETVTGGVTVNNTLFHVAQDNLPFGGVGPSGMGHYHGVEGFRTFSKAKSIFYDGRLSGSVLLRPPYGKLFRLVMRVLYR